MLLPMTHSLLPSSFQTFVSRSMQTRWARPVANRTVGEFIECTDALSNCKEWAKNGQCKLNAGGP